MACMIGPPVCPAASSIWRPPTPRRAWVGPWTPRRAGYPSLVIDRLREEGLEPLALQASTRDEPVHLSDSRPETHQHFWPTGATCCQSLLLDPDATIGIDLHKRLFLLVTGRGE
jgi:hypothetical protein